MVRSVSANGRRRSGIVFGPVAIAVDLFELSPRECDALVTDPQLIVDPPQDLPPKTDPHA